MKRKQIITVSIFMAVMLFFITSCNGQNENEKQDKKAKTELNQSHDFGKKENPKVTFVELGSVRCIPCQKMQPVMRAVDEKYGEQLQVIFYDVWREDQKQYAVQYGIRLIPTQVFLNDKGEEIFRHEGFFPEAEIDKFLQTQGLSL
jgi:thioredoxin 1